MTAEQSADDLATENKTFRKTPERAILFFKFFFMAHTIKKSVKVALVVGSVLILINHFDILISGNISTLRLLQIAATPFAPFCVSAYSIAVTLLNECPSISEQEDKL